MKNDFRDIAIIAHGDQKYGEHPYVYHLDAVRVNAIAYHTLLCDMIGKPYDFFLNELDAVAYFHDILEDVGAEALGVSITVAAGDINKGVVFKSVTLLSDYGDRAMWRERMLEACATNPADLSTNIAAFVKWCDRLANVEEGEKNQKYRDEHCAFKLAFTPEILEFLDPLVWAVEKELWPDATPET